MKAEASEGWRDITLSFASLVSRVEGHLPKDIARAAGYIDAISTAIDFYEFRSAGAETPAPIEKAAQEGKGAPEKRKGKRRGNTKITNEKMAKDFGKYYKDLLASARLRLHFRESGVRADETGKASYESALEEYNENRALYDLFFTFAKKLYQNWWAWHNRKSRSRDGKERMKTTIEPKSLPVRMTLGLAVEMSLRLGAAQDDIEKYFNALAYGSGDTILGLIYDGFHPEKHTRGRRAFLCGELTGYVYDGFVDYLRYREELP